MKISGVILTKNEENNISCAIKSLSFCDEVILIDDYSTDKTEAIAKDLGAKVLKRRLNDDFSGQRNFGMEKSGGEWILFLDADEEITYNLSTEIEQLLANPEKQAYYIKRRDFWWGTELKHGEIKDVRGKGLLRLMTKDSGKWTAPVHETFQTSHPTGRLNSYINHYPHDSLKEFLKEINFYSTLRARELAKGRKNGIFQLIFYPLGKFINTYFVKRGFLDGPAGFAYAFFNEFPFFFS